MTRQGAGNAHRDLGHPMTRSIKQSQHQRRVTLGLVQTSMIDVSTNSEN